MEAWTLLKQINKYVDDMPDTGDMKAIKKRIKDVRDHVPSASKLLIGALKKTVASGAVCEKLTAAGKNLDDFMSLIKSDECWNVWNSGIGAHEDVKVSTHQDEEKGQYYLKIEVRVDCC